MQKMFRNLFSKSALCTLAAGVLSLCVSPVLQAQDWFHLEISSGADRIRIAVADFKPQAGDPATDGYKRTFDTTLFADLNAAGIFDIVSKSVIPQSAPGTQAEINLSQWSAPPSAAAMVAFGSLGTRGGKLVVNGFLDDAKNAQFPQVFSKQYSEEASEDQARQIAHRFADEIISRLGGGVSGIAETKIYYVKIMGQNKEIWEM